MDIEHISISFGTGTAAFQDSPTTEIGRILREMAERFEQDGFPSGPIYDLNGNLVGEVQISEQ